MNVRTAFLAVILWGIFTPGSTWAQSFAGLGSNADGFAEVVPGREIVFTRDFGPHRDFRIEWWYVTANLQTADGRPLGAQWTLFRQAVKPGAIPKGWSGREFWLGHAAVTSKDKHFFAEKLARGGTGQAGAKSVPFEAWIDDWSIRENEADAEKMKSYQLSAAGDAFQYALTLKENGRPILHGQDGYSPKSDSGRASYYFSHPFLDVTGTVTVGEETLEVTGTAWLDREWSSQPLAENQEGWDWFSLRFDSGERLMVFSLRDSGSGKFVSGTWIGADGSTQQLHDGDIVMKPMELALIAGRNIPVRWSLSIPSKAFEVTVIPLNPHSWMATSIEYWEGPVTAVGSHNGQGYLEMTGH